MTLELGRATARKPPFEYSALARVGFSDTDAQGVVEGADLQEAAG